jgi:hypothetical protein
MNERLFVYFDKFEPLSRSVDGAMKRIFVDAVNEMNRSSFILITRG